MYPTNPLINNSPPQDLELFSNSSPFGIPVKLNFRSSACCLFPDQIECAPLQTEEILVDILRIGEREQSDLCPLSISDKWQNKTKTENEKKWSAISEGIKCTREREIPLANLWRIILYIFVTDAWFGFFFCAKKSQQIFLSQSPLGSNQPYDSN